MNKRYMSSYLVIGMCLLSLALLASERDKEASSQKCKKVEQVSGINKHRPPSLDNVQKALTTYMGSPKSPQDKQKLQDAIASMYPSTPKSRTPKSSPKPSANPSPTSSLQGSSQNTPR